MDLPGVIDMHLRTMSMARERGIPVHAVGVGVGPCNNFMSRAAVRQILRRCETVQVRSIADAGRASAWNVAVAVGRDPAFDYLEDRVAAMSLAPHRSVDDRARRTIAINLRPLWKKYVESTGMESVMDRVVEAFTGLIDSRGADTDFVFLPFNADQFGFSDLSIAYRLQAALRDPTRLKIIEKELDIDEALVILRQCDGAIAMRFHACIFAMAAGLPVVGIDYSDKPSGKVRMLLEESGSASMVLSVTDISETKLIEASDLLRRSDTRRGF
jgi:polysaccharide pyruvyl transferase WcaK-like protein